MCPPPEIPTLEERLGLFNSFCNIILYKFKTINSDDIMFHIRKNKSLAFTLAEVLITLGIIGVVAALTLPSVIEKHQKKVFATKVKQTYSIISNALVSSVADNGPPSTWDYGDSFEADSGQAFQDPENARRIVDKYFLPYLKVIKKDMANNMYYLVLSNGTTITFTTDGWIDNTTNTYIRSVLYIIVSLNNNTSQYGSSTRDYSKKDVIMKVSIDEQNAKVSMFNWGGDTRDEIKNTSVYACNKNIAKHQRYNCGALLQYDGWEIKDDYPW